MNTESMQKRGGAWATAASVVAAIASSACCWLPLSLLALGISGGTIAATFEEWRPVFLPLTFLLLGTAFYLTYRKPKAAVQGTASSASMGEDSCCAAPGEMSGAGGDSDCCPPANVKGFTLKKLNKGMLWVATVVVLAFAFFPSYVGTLLGADSENIGTETTTQAILIDIEGMTCGGCAVTVEKALGGIPGVKHAVVSFEESRAIVTLDSTSAALTEILVEAVARVGFKAGLPDGK